MRRRLARLAILALCAAALPGCTRRLYEGGVPGGGNVAVIHVGSVIVREIDGERRRGGAFDYAHFEVPPGPHRLALVFELPMQTYGVKQLPARSGEGICELAFTAEAGKNYYLGARALGETISTRWDGRWEGWIRDPTVSAADDIIARCSSHVVSEEPTAVAIASPSPAAPAPAAPVPPAPVPAPPAMPPVSPAGAAASPESIRLGTWNVRDLGRSAGKDYARLAQAINQHFDVLTLTEVAPTAGGHAGYDRLLAALGSGWGGLLSPAPLPAGAAGEYYAVLYRRDRVRPCDGWSAMRSVSDDPDRFLRAPAFACLEAGDPAAPAVDFLLAAYRAPTADGDAAATAAEVSRLDDAFTAMKLARPGEEDLIIAGDFNLESIELVQVLSATDRTRGQGSKLNLLGDRSASLPDHIVVADPHATAELLGDAEAVDVRGVATSPAEFYRTVSDHLPIMVRLRATGTDDD